MKKQDIINSRHIITDLTNLLNSLAYDKLFVLTDKHTLTLCLPKLQSIPAIRESTLITVPAGDDAKNIDSLSLIWHRLSTQGGTRHSLLINLGGGMLTDLGGFAAATFKRGIRFINIPTTLLGAVDAAVGGKTGINFLHLKNEIGAFAPASAVLIHSDFFRTLNTENILSGYAELLKHALIDSYDEWKRAINFNFHEIDYNRLQTLLIDSVAVKERIVASDPYEQGIRKALNLGHTFAHAFESLAMKKKQPIPHGYAVAWGMICELYLSAKQCHFPQETLWSTTQFVKENYGTYHCGCDSYEQLIEYMQHDKKNASIHQINFTLLEDVGKIKINQTGSKQDIFEALDFMREGTGG